MIPPGAAVLGAALVVAFGALFYRWVVKQGHLSVQMLEDWGHALVIPLISGWMLWSRRAELARTPISTFWPGLAPALLGVVCYLFFVVGVPNHMLQGFSIVLTLFGVVLLVLGPAIMRHAFLPIGYLAFAVTLAEQIMIEVTFKLKLIASYGSWILLSATGPLIGYSVQRDGNLLHMMRLDGTSFPMNVAEACSGMRMVVAFVALGGAVALLGTTRWWQRTAIMLLTVPVAVLMNVVRVAVLGWLGYFDENLAGGEAHTLIGTILLLPSLLLFMFLVWALDRLIVEDKGQVVPGKSKGSGGAGKKSPTKAATKQKVKKQPLGPPPPGSGTAGLWRALRSPALVVAIAVLGTTAAGMGAAVSYFRLYLRKLPIYAPGGRTLAAIPTETEHWIRVGQDQIEPPDVVKMLGTENYITRRYMLKSTVGQPIPTVLQLHAAYYTGTIDTVPHVPERCFVGGGMEIGSWAAVLPLRLDRTNWLLDRDVEEDPSLASLHGRVYTTKLSNEYGDSGGARVRLPIDPASIQMRITGFLIPGGREVFSGYFFIANGETTPSAAGVRLLAFRLDDDYAYYLKVQFTSDTAESAERLAEDAALLMNDLLGEIMRCAPDWIEVERGVYPENNPRANRAGGPASGLAGSGASDPGA